MQKTDHNENEVGVEEVEENDEGRQAEETTKAAEQAAPSDGEDTGEDTHDAAAQQDDPAAADELSALRTELSALRTELEQKAAEAKANYERFLRERAELENFKRRMQREKSEALRFANEPLVRDLLPVVDNLERAVVHTEGGGDGQPLVAGVQLVLRSFVEVLEKHGVTRVPATGEPFDPARHEAMAQVESEELPPHTVIEEHTPGYSLYARLLRAALVSVSKAPAGGDSDQDSPDKKSEG